MLDSPGEIRVVDVDTLREACREHGKVFYANLGATALFNSDEPLLSLLCAMSKDFDHLGQEVLWEDYLDDADDFVFASPSTIPTLQGKEVDEPEEEFDEKPWDTNNPFLYGACLAYFAFFRNQELPVMGEGLFNSVLQRLDSDRVKLDKDCLDALEQDEQLRDLITREDMGDNVADAPGSQCERIAAQLGAGAVSYLLNEQHQLSQLTPGQQLQRNNFELN